MLLLSSMMKILLFSVSDLRKLRSKLELSIPANADEFMLILKRFANLIYATCSENSPLFLSLREIIWSLHDFCRAARKAFLSLLTTKGSTLWITLLQARQFSMGEAAILFEFTNMKNHVFIIVKYRPSSLLQETMAMIHPTWGSVEFGPYKILRAIDALRKGIGPKILTIDIPAWKWSLRNHWKEPISRASANHFFAKSTRTASLNARVDSVYQTRC